MFSVRRCNPGSAGRRCRRTRRSARRPTRSATATVVGFFYRNTANQFVAYNPASPPAPDVIQQTTTDQGKTVPFIVERVTGTANRGIYQFALLVDPTKPVSPWTEQPWNHKFVNSFGGACGVNYQQPTVGNQLGGANATLLGRGFAVGTSSLNTYGNQCNDIISAEALMMTKEILTERHGPIRYTIGTGGSVERCSSTRSRRRTPPARRHHHQPLRGPLVPGRQLVRLHPALALLRAAERLLGLPNNPNPLFLTAAERRRCGARTRPARTTCAGRRSTSRWSS